MKKISSVLLALFLSLSLASCVAPNEDSHTDAKENDVSTSAATEIGTVAVETEPENEHPTTPVPELTPEAVTFGNLKFANREGYQITFSDNTYIIELNGSDAAAFIQVTDAHDLSDSSAAMLLEMLMDKMISSLSPRDDEQPLADVIAGYDATGSSFFHTNENGATVLCINLSFVDGYYAYNIVLLCNSDSQVVSGYLEKFQSFLDALEYCGQANSEIEGATYGADEGNKTELGTKPYPAGAYKVGTDIPADEYLFVCTGSSIAYFCVSSDSNQDDIIENENFANCFFATLEDGQYLVAKRCSFVNADSYSLSVDASYFEEGVYRVGIDIPSGEYKLSATEGSYGYYCVYENSTVPFDIVTNDNFESSAYVTVAAGQYLQISRCSATIVE